MIFVMCPGVMSAVAVLWSEVLKLTFSGSCVLCAMLWCICVLFQVQGFGLFRGVRSKRGGGGRGGAVAQSGCFWGRGDGVSRGSGEAMESGEVVAPVQCRQFPAGSQHNEPPPPHNEPSDAKVIPNGSV